MFTAIWPKEKFSIYRQILRESPVQIWFKSNELTVIEAITEVIKMVKDFEKKETLAKNLNELSAVGRWELPMMLIFVETKKNADSTTSS